MDIGVKQGKIVGLRGRNCDRVQQRSTWSKGPPWVMRYPSDICCRTDPSSWVANAHKDRLLHPLIRKNGQLERASWREAMSLIAKKAREVQERLTNHGIGFC